jgi:hypothetical protein
VSRQRALAVAKQLLEQGEEMVDQAMNSASQFAPTAPTVGRQASALAEELIATSKTNRDLLIGVVRSEVDRAVDRLGLSDRDDVAALNRMVERLQRQLDAAIAFGTSTARSAASGSRPGGRAGSRPGTKKAAGSGRTTPAKAAKAATAAKKASAGHSKSSGTGGSAKKAAAKKSARKAGAKDAVAKKNAAGPSAAPPPAPAPPRDAPSSPARDVAGEAHRDPGAQP